MHTYVYINMCAHVFIHKAHTCRYIMHMNADTCVHTYICIHIYSFLKPLVISKSSSTPWGLRTNKEISTLVLGSLHSSQKNNEHVNKEFQSDSAINSKCLIWRWGCYLSSGCQGQAISEEMTFDWRGRENSRCQGPEAGTNSIFETQEDGLGGWNGAKRLLNEVGKVEGPKSCRKLEGSS